MIDGIGLLPFAVDSIVKGNIVRRNLVQLLSTSIRFDWIHKERIRPVAQSYEPPWWRMAHYYLARLVVNPLIRRCIVRFLGLWIGKNEFVGKNTHQLLQVLKDDGIVKLEQTLSESECNDISAYLSKKPVHDRHGSVERTVSDALPVDLRFGFHSIESVLNCPHILEFVSSPDIVQLAAEYLGCNPTLSGLGVQWSFPTNSPGVVQRFHRDSEDWKYLRFLIYLSDVDEGCGPHIFIKGSHRDKLPLRLKFYSTEEISRRYGDDSFSTVYGKRGTGVAVDTCGIHKGELPTTNPRLVLTFTYSILAYPFFLYEPIHTRHSAAMKNYTNRLFLR